MAKTKVVLIQLLQNEKTSNENHKLILMSYQMLSGIRNKSKLANEQTTVSVTDSLTDSLTNRLTKFIITNENIPLNITNYKDIFSNVSLIHL